MAVTESVLADGEDVMVRRDQAGMTISSGRRGREGRFPDGTSPENQAPRLPTPPPATPYLDSPPFSPHFRTVTGESDD